MRRLSIAGVGKQASNWPWSVVVCGIMRRGCAICVEVCDATGVTKVGAVCLAGFLLVGSATHLIQVQRSGR